MHGDFYNHDPISTALVKYGAVPVGLAMLLVIPAIAHLHRSALSIRDEGSRHFAIACLAVAAGSVAVSMVGGNLMATFPGNAFLALPIGMIFALSRTDRLNAGRQADTVSSPSERVQPQLAQPWEGSRMPWRQGGAAPQSYR
jgi:hypothetical protein